MPINAGIQVRNYTVGRIRAGDKDEKGRPHRLDGFRFTSPSQKVAVEAAEFFQGDDVRRWGQEWEVYTRLREIAVALPPGALVIDQSMMRWSGGGPVMVCDGVSTTRPRRGPCQCPQPDDPCDPESVWAAINERRRLAAQKVPAGCYPYTWINVTLPDIGGFGVWKLLSKSENAAAEIIQQAILLERARAAGQYLPARLALEYRESRVDGLLRQYNVPALRIDDSVRSIAERMPVEIAGRPLAEQLPPAPGQARAITAGAPAVTRAAPGAREDMTPGGKAQQIAERAVTAATRKRIEELIGQAEGEGVDHDMVRVEQDGRELFVDLRDHLRGIWKDLPRTAEQDREAS